MVEIQNEQVRNALQRWLFRCAGVALMIPLSASSLPMSCHSCATRGGATRSAASSAWPGGGVALAAQSSGAADAASLASTPQVLYTDIVAGPSSGGENDKGVYLSIFGKYFGREGLGERVKVFINDVEVDNYRYLGPSRGRRDIQQITVQVGAIGNPKPGVALPIKVVVNGVASNTDHTFTVQPGDFLFVSTSGDDRTAVKNDIKHPWRYLQTPKEGGALAAVRPGDVIVLRGGPNVVWSDTGFEERWCRFRRTTGNAPTGVKGHGYISIMPYPKEDVHYVPPPDTSGGIHGIGENYPEFSDWIVVSGLHIESVASSRSDAGPINLNAHSDHWRVVNNELGPWPAPPTAQDKAAGVVGNGVEVAVLGNHIHDIGGGKENHGIYLDSGATHVDIAYNWIHDVVSGNLIQSHDNLGGFPINDVRVHHNLLYNGGRFGLNISEGTHSYSAWNNLIYNTALAGIRFNVFADASSSFVIVHNTIWNTNRVWSIGDGAIANDWHLNKGSALIKNNIIAKGPETKGAHYFVDGSEGQAIEFERNLWYGHAELPRDKNPISRKKEALDPRFVSLGQGDCALAPGSPAVDEASATLPFPVLDDFNSVRRPLGARADVGACERVAATPPPKTKAKK